MTTPQPAPAPEPGTPYDAEIAHLAARTIEPDGALGRQLQVLRAKQEGYRVGVAETEAQKDAEWHDGYDHGQGHERTATEALVAALGGITDRLGRCLSCDAQRIVREALATWNQAHSSADEGRKA